MLKLRIGYPSREEERQILERMAVTRDQPEIAPSSSRGHRARRSLVDDIYVDDKIKDYVVSIVFATREPPPTSSTSRRSSSTAPRRARRST
jgi:MoxR-like ATPase